MERPLVVRPQGEFVVESRIVAVSVIGAIQKHVWKSPRSTPDIALLYVVGRARESTKVLHSDMFPFPSLEVRSRPILPFNLVESPDVHLPVGEGRTKVGRVSKEVRTGRRVVQHENVVFPPNEQSGGVVCGSWEHDRVISLSHPEEEMVSGWSRLLS